MRDVQSSRTSDVYRAIEPKAVGSGNYPLSSPCWSVKRISDGCVERLRSNLDLITYEQATAVRIFLSQVASNTLRAILYAILARGLGLGPSGHS